jgi:hypothetical protein
MKHYWDGRFWPLDWIQLPARCVFVDCFLNRLQCVFLRRIPVSCALRTHGIQLPPNCLPGECINTLIGHANVNVKNQFQDGNFNLLIESICPVRFSLIVIYIFLGVVLTPEYQGRRGFNCLRFACLVNAPTRWLAMPTLILKNNFEMIVLTCWSNPSARSCSRWLLFISLSVLLSFLSIRDIRDSIASDLLAWWMHQHIDWAC